MKSAIKVFANYKQLAEKAMAQMEDGDLNWQANDDSNSVVNIVKHLHGNMLSRWTDFLTTDGEKPTRERDEEFAYEHLTRERMAALWEEGWQRMFDTLNALTDDDLQKTVFIRKEPLTVMDAVNRQIAHYASHVGQIVYIAKIRRTKEWQSMSIPKGKSKEFNEQLFGK